MIARVLCAAPHAPFWHQAAAHARVSAAPAAAFPGLLPRAVDAFHLYSWADAAACSAAHTCLLAPCRSCGAGTWCSQCRMAGRGPRSCCANPPACAHREGVCCLCGAEARQRKQQAPAAEHCGRLRARMKPGPQLPPACGRPWSPTDSGTGMAETGGWGLVWTVCHGMVHVLLATYSCWLAAALGRLLHGCSRGVAAAGLDVGDRPRVALLVPAHVGVRQRSEMAGFAARHGFIAGCCCDWRWRGEDSCPRRFVQTGVDSRLGMR